MKSIIGASIILLLLISCSDQAARDSFYFPVPEFSVETTYYFVNQNDTTEKSVWKMKSTLSNDDTLLQTSIFDGQNHLLETMVENVNGGDSKISSYVLYYYDAQGIQHSSVCQVIDSMVFKIGQTISEQIDWKVRFVDSTTSSVCELFKTRKLVKQDESQMTFNDIMKFENFETGESYQYSMTSIYEQGKGLVSFTMELPGRATKIFILASVK